MSTEDEVKALLEACDELLSEFGDYSRESTTVQEFQTEWWRPCASMIRTDTVHKLKNAVARVKGDSLARVILLPKNKRNKHRSKEHGTR